MTEWRAVRVSTSTVEPDLYDVTVTDSVNRFARSATLKIDDPDGTKKSKYPRGERVEVEYSKDGGSTYTRRFAGFLLEPATQKSVDGGRSIVEVEVLGYDNLFRRRDLYETYSSQSISSILEDLIRNNTSIKWVPGNVDVVNDKTISREFRGERVEKAIGELAGISGSEDYGVNDDLEFFFRPESIDRAPADITDGDWIDYDLPESGKRSVNKVRLFYGESGSKSSVIVEDRSEQLSLKNELNAPSRVVIEETATYPEISSEATARRKAEEILRGRSQTQTGSVTTVEREAVEAGEVFRLEISEKGIDTDFRVAEIEYQWRQGLTKLKVAENSGNVSDLLVGLADSVSRVSARDADPTASFTRFLELPAEAQVSESIEVREIDFKDKTFIAGITRDTPGIDTRDDEEFARISENRTTTTASDDGALTVEALNALRDVWQGDSAPTLDVIAAGKDDSPASKADDTLGNRQDDAGATAAARGRYDILFATSLPVRAVGIDTFYEFGLFTSNGDLHYRTTTQKINAEVDRVEVNITWTFEDASPRGVVTNNGQETWRDLYLGDGSAPSDMAVGTGTADPVEADTALASQVDEQALTETADEGQGETSVVSRWSTSEINSNDLTEIGEENGDDELLTRIVFESLSKTSDFALEVNHETTIQNKT